MLDHVAARLLLLLHHLMVSRWGSHGCAVGAHALEELMQRRARRLNHPPCRARKVWAKRQFQRAIQILTYQNRTLP